MKTLKLFLLSAFLLIPSLASAQRYEGRIGTLSFEQKLALGEISGMYSVNKFGRTSDADNSWEDVWDGNNTTDNIANISSTTTGAAALIYSDSALDDDGGLGCTRLFIEGVDYDFKRSSESIIMDGLTLVTSATTYMGIDRMICTHAGNNAVQGGNIFAMFATLVEDTTQAMITDGTEQNGQTLMAIRYIARDETALIKNYYADLNKATGSAIYGSFRLMIRGLATTSNTPFMVKNLTSVTSAGTSHMMHVFNPPIKIVGPAIIKIQGFMQTDNQDVSTGFDLIILKHSD